MGCRNSDVIVSDCVIRENEASLAGGGVSFNIGTALLRNTLIKENRSSDRGGGTSAAQTLCWMPVPLSIIVQRITEAGDAGLVGPYR